jgi:hypothetical protein
LRQQGCRAPFLPDGADLGGNDGGIDRPGIARRTKDRGLPKSGGSEFLEEGNTFLGAGDSGKPVFLARAHPLGKGLAQNQFSDKRDAARPQDTRQFREDGVPCGIEIEDAINHGGFDFPIP